MTAKINITFSDSANYTYDTDLIDVSGGSAQLKLINDPQPFTQTYASSTGFTFNASNTEFSGGTCRQLDQQPANSTCWAKFSTDVNLNYGGGTLTGTAVGGTIDSGYLKFTGVSGQQLSFSATNNFTSQQAGAIKFIYRPQYSGSPTNNQMMVCVSEDNGDTTNQILLVHETSGNIRVYFYDSSDTLTNHVFGSWSPSLNTDYEIEFNFELTTGAQSVFIDGAVFGTDGTLSLTRSSSIGLIRVGADASGSDSPNFWMKDLVFFSTVQHTSAYTAGYTLPVKRYLGDLITLPTFTYSGVGNVQKYNSFSVVETGNIVYSVNNLYWNGSAWVFSSGSVGQMNSATTINTRIGSLPASNTLIIKARTSDSNTQMLMDNLESYYNGQIYPTSNPTIEPISTFNMEQLLGFLESSIKTGTDEVKYILRTNGGYVWWNGSAWASSSGIYTESNTAAEILTNIATFTTSNIIFNFRMFLHSGDGSTTPIVSNVEVEYDFAGDPEDSIHITSVWFYSRYPDGTADTSTYTAIPSETFARYSNNILVQLKEVEVTPQANGYTEFELMETKSMKALNGIDGVTYDIMNGTERVARIEVDITTGVLLWDAIK